MLFVFRALSILPLWLLHPLGWLMGWLTFLASPTYRRRFLANAAQAGYGLRQVHQAVGHAGCMVSELPRLWLGRPVRLEWDNEACVEAAYRAGRGILFLTPHIGCFEVTAQGVAARYGAQYGLLTVMFRPARQPWLSRLVESSRHRPGLDTAPTTLAGVRKMLKAMRRGQAVGLLPDQVPPEGQGLWTSFFDRDAYTMTLAARLAQQGGATLLLAWGERLAWGRGYRLHFRGPAQPLGADLAQAVQQINAEMEQLVRECPQQYLWGYARYKQPRQEQAGA
ncbi:MAG: lysophospholipid acyltransferase family protein [Burkholderiaceae bacterium]|nr:MAG: lysophospholipid acyltransferase family protein [Burkholderiaceae bacterium]